MHAHRDALRNLQQALPPSSALAELGDPDPDRQARAALALVVETALNEQDRPQVERTAGQCPNCGADTLSLRSPYCGDPCREQAAFVRQFRHGLSTGTLFEPERQVGAGQAAWKALGGGYTRRSHLLTPKAVGKVLERDGGRCFHCGAPATTVEHIGSG